MTAPRTLPPPTAWPVARSPPRRHPPPPRHHLHRQQLQHKQQGEPSVLGVGLPSAWLSHRTPVLGLRSWVLVAAGAAAAVLALLCLAVCLCRRCRRRPRLAPCPHRPGASKSLKHRVHAHQAMTMPAKDIEEAAARWRPPPFEPPVEYIKEEQTAPLILVEQSARTSGETATSSGDGGSTESGGGSYEAEPEAARRGWGRRYTRREMEKATGGLADGNVIGEGSYGVVYRGVLRDNTAVAIKNLHNNRGQAEKDFRMEVATIGRVRHKNLVSLLGYCSEGACRMLVYQYMENSNLDKWLHHDDSEISPLTWDIRMHVLLGTAKGLAYLHEGLEPKIVHRDIKSSNILLDRHWNAKVSDFGLAKLLCSEKSYVATRVMGTFGYVAPEYARTGMLNERSDVYSFGVLVMEIITGRSPVDYTRPTDEVNLVEWLKRMVAEKRVEEVLDPRLPERPPSKVLKRVVLAALRCVDPDGGQRPTMAHVVHMLEDDLISRDELKLARDLSPQASSSYER
ncbi:probable serine/threonine-protein kinase At1g01540 [Phragmites australis]|uniref:probable serine/threonine-protein kinase At1g01540 n=1 Tax=Phragmites australis TaxID=29695 RepID=UPI002D79C0DC|nr:probable serine/threonine-protein kinase At1g01540 [Phragmites australis]